MTIIGFWKWGFRADIKLHITDDKSPKINSSLNFRDLITKRVPEIDTSKKLWLNPLLFNGALQTLYYGMHQSDTEFPIYYGRELFKYKDGGVCSLDWVMPPPKSSDEFTRIYKQTIPEDSPKLHPRTRFFTPEELSARTASAQTSSQDPICVVFHGLAGGSHEPLIRNLACQLTEDVATKWDVVVVNSRGCCRTKITTGKLFSGLSISDVEEVFVELKKRFPNRPLYGVGFSFGAVLLANYLGTAGEGAQKVLKAASLIGCPWDMVESARHIDSSLTGRYLLNPNLAVFLNKLIKSNSKELKELQPEVFNDETFKKARQAKKTYQWDDAITCKTIGFKDSWAYYYEASPVRRAHNIAVPTLSINSSDDPTVSPHVPYDLTKTNPYLAMVETNLGGHLGWVQYSGEFWSVGAAKQFMNQFQALST